MMKKKVLILPFFFLLFSVNCNKDNNPITQLESNGYNKLLIETDSMIYNWKQSEQGDYILIYGTIINETDTVFYSRIGGLFGGGRSFSGNSDAFLEKFDPSENVWRTKDIVALLYEGTKFVPLQPFENSSFSSQLTKKSDPNESGAYRFRLDYYSEADPDSNAVTYFDYSNEFIIEQ